MRKGAVLSGLLHVAIALVAIFGLPSLFNPPEVAQPIPVEVVTVAELTTPPKVEEAPTPEPAPPEPPKPAPPEPEPPKPEPPKPVAALPPPPPEPEPVPPPAVAPPEPEPEPEPAVAKAEPKPTPLVKPKPPPKPAEPDFASVLKNVEKLKQQAAKRPTPEETPPEATPRSLADQPLTMSEEDAIKRQIERCWSPPAWARDAENLVVEIRVRLNPDGSVFQAEILDIDRMARDGFFRAAAESARRAVLLCSPLQLPPKKYAQWKVITLNFDLKEMLGI